MTRSYCQQHGITYQAWSPLSSINLGNPPLPAIAAAHGVSTAQVALRWITQQGGCPFAVSPGIRKEGGRYVGRGIIVSFLHLKLKTNRTTNVQMNMQLLCHFSPTYERLQILSGHWAFRCTKLSRRKFRPVVS